MSKTPNPPKSTPASPIDTSTHKLVESLLGTEPPPYDSAVLIGYFGPSQRDGYVRLYVSPDLRSYYEIPIAEIVSTGYIEPGNTSSPTRVLVKNATTIEAKQLLIVSPETSFLKAPATTSVPPAATIEDLTTASGMLTITANIKKAAFDISACTKTHPFSF